jgi:hypothetical protein
MARRRMISQELIIDEDFNSLSLQAQNIFTRLLAVSDDYGVIPANVYTLDKLINTPKKIDLAKSLNEIIALNLIFLLEYQGKQFYVFKRDRFDEYQSYLIQKRTKSEYLRLSKEEIDSEKFQEILRNYSNLGSSPIESIKYKVESTKIKEEDKKPYGEFGNVLLTDKERQRLTERLSTDQRAKNAIEILSAYKKSKNKQYNSDYATFHTWVITELEKRENQGKPNQNTKSITTNQRKYHCNTCKREIPKTIYDIDGLCPECANK